MKLTLLAYLMAIALFPSTLHAPVGSDVEGQSHPIPPGVRQADQTEDQTQKNIPPPLNERPKANPQKLKADADELSALAQSIPAAMDQTTKGAIPKDLTTKLKRIEKLAKELRSQLNP